MASHLQRLELSARPLRLQLSALILQWHLQDVASSNHFLPLQGGHGTLCDFSEVEGEEGGLEDEGEGEGVTEGVGEGDGEMVVVVGGGGGGISREDGGEGVWGAWFVAPSAPLVLCLDFPLGFFLSCLVHFRWDLVVGVG